jgi:hypothetical protein
MIVLAIITQFKKVGGIFTPISGAPGGGQFPCPWAILKTMYPPIKPAKSIASEAKKTNMPNFGSVKRGPAEETGMAWADGIVVVVMKEFDLGLNRLFGDNEINPKSGHDQGSRNKKKKNSKIGFA